MFSADPRCVLEQGTFYQNRMNPSVALFTFYTNSCCHVARPGWAALELVSFHANSSAHSREWGCESLFLPRKLPVTGLIAGEFWEEEPGWGLVVVSSDGIWAVAVITTPVHTLHTCGPQPSPSLPCQPFLSTFSHYTVEAYASYFSVAISSFPVIFQNKIERNTWEPCVCISHNIFVWHNYDSGHNYSFRSLLRKHLPNPRHTVLQLLISTMGHAPLWEWYG